MSFSLRVSWFNEGRPTEQCPDVVRHGPAASHRDRVATGDDAPRTRRRLTLRHGPQRERRPRLRERRPLCCELFCYAEATTKRALEFFKTPVRHARVRRISGTHGRPHGRSSRLDPRGARRQQSRVRRHREPRRVHRVSARGTPRHRPPHQRADARSRPSAEEPERGHPGDGGMARAHRRRETRGARAA